MTALPEVVEQPVAEDRIWSLRLLGLADARRDKLITLSVLLLLTVSRLALLPNGPWEQDEAIFARSILAFDAFRHFPHPPFFPGWMALGFLFTPVINDPLRTFQLLSSLASIACLWPLVFLARRVARPSLAFASAVAVEFFPGVWFHSVRAFDSTAAVFPLFLAAALLFRRFDGRRFMGFSLLLLASFLIRPVFLPVVAVLWVAGARKLRRRSPVALSLLVMGALGLLAFAPIVINAGGMTAFIGVFLGHAESHVADMSSYAWSLPGLGPVTSCGGVWPTFVVLAATIVGLGVWRRRCGTAGAALYGGILLLVVVMLLFIHARTFPRYSAPLLMGLAPLVAGALSLLRGPASTGPALAAVTAAAYVVVWWPVMWEQHSTRLALWKAAIAGLEQAGRSDDTQAFGATGGWVFVSYYDKLARWRGRWEGEPAPAPWVVPATRDPLASHWIVVAPSTTAFVPSSPSRVERFAGGSPALVRLSQHRYLSAQTVSDPPILVGQWWPLETAPDGRKFAWGSAGAEVLVPAVKPDSLLRLTVRPAVGEQPVRVVVNSTLTLTLPGDSGVTTLQVRPAALFTDHFNRIDFQRDATYPPGGGDTRPLSLALYEVEIGRYRGFEVGLDDTKKLAREGIELSGFYGVERFAGTLGRWAQPDAEITVPVGEGTLELTLLAPRPDGATVEATIAGRRAGGPWQVTQEPQKVRVAVESWALGPRALRLELHSSAYVPARHGGHDSRRLGVVVSSLKYSPK
jgi:hypothetical protein